MEFGPQKLRNPVIVGKGIDIAGLAANAMLPPGDRLTDRRVDLRLDYLVETAGLDPDIAATYSSASIEPHLTGVADLDDTQIHSINSLKRDTLQKCMEYYAFMDSPALRFIDESHGSERLRQGFVNGHVDWTNEGVDAWITGMRENARDELGLTAIRDIVVWHRVCYAPEMKIPNEMVISQGDVRLAPGLFTKAEQAEGITESQLTLRLRDRGVLDMSKERLDARTGNLLDVIHMETRTLFLGALQDMWILGGRPRIAAEQQYAAHRFALWENGAAARDALFGQLRARMLRLAQTPRHPKEQEALMAMAERITGQTGRLVGMQDIYTDVYRALGYTMPDSFMFFHGKPAPQPQETAPPRGDLAASVAVVAGLTATKELVEQPVVEPDPEVVSDFRQRADALRAEVAKEGGPWTMSAKARENAKLGPVVKNLMSRDGSRDNDGNVLLPHMERREAEEIVAVLYRLGRLGGREDLSDARSQLAAASAAHVDLPARVRNLQNEALRAGVRSDVDYPSVVPVDRHIGWIGNEWTNFALALPRVWPENTAETLIANIERLLFAGEDT